MLYTAHNIISSYGEPNTDFCTECSIQHTISLFVMESQTRLFVRNALHSTQYHCFLWRAKRFFFCTECSLQYVPKWCRTLGRTFSSDCTAFRWYSVCASSNWQKSTNNHRVTSLFSHSLISQTQMTVVVLMKRTEKRYTWATKTTRVR